MVSCKIISLMKYSGLNDKESRTQFTHVISLGAKNIYKIFAGGNHSWVVIDDIMPIREHYEPPSPVGYAAPAMFSQQHCLSGPTSPRETKSSKMKPVKKMN